MATKTLTLNADIEHAYAQIAQSLAGNKADITTQQPPSFLAFTLGHSSLWTSFLKLKLEGKVNLEPLPDAQTVAHIEIKPADNAVLSNVGFQGIFTAIFGLLFLGPLALLVAPLGAAGLYPYLNNTMPEQVLDKLDDNIPGSSQGGAHSMNGGAHSMNGGAHSMNGGAHSMNGGAQSKNAIPAPSSRTQETVFAQLKSLGELRDSGVLSVEEFEGKKSELLARI
jgi:Short C-terminal domain